MKHYLLAPIYFIYKLWIGFVFWISLLVLYPFFAVLLSREEWFPVAFKLKRCWATFLRFALFCPMSKQIKGPLPNSPFIIVSNHSSHLDTVFMYCVVDRYFLFIGKGELLKWPLFRLFFRTMDIPINRENRTEAYRSLQKAYDAIDRKECVAMYPEGTIPLSSPRMKSFKNGAFKMAADKNIPIVPITWLTNYRVMNNPEKLFSPSLPHRIHVVVHEAIYPTGREERDVIALRQQVFERIESTLNKVRDL
jgi:1-acyl-sn-glycerol-3-phosphate acyltransferase